MRESAGDQEATHFIPTLSRAANPLTSEKPEPYLFSPKGSRPTASREAPAE